MVKLIAMDEESYIYLLDNCYYFKQVFREPEKISKDQVDSILFHRLMIVTTKDFDSLEDLITYREEIMLETMSPENRERIKYMVEHPKEWIKEIISSHVKHFGLKDYDERILKYSKKPGKEKLKIFYERLKKDFLEQSQNKENT